MAEKLKELSFDTNPYLRKIDADPVGHFLNLRNLLRVADENEFGVLAANCIRPEIVRGVLRAAYDTNSPLIVQIAESQVSYALDGWFSSAACERLEAFSDFVASEVSEFNRERGYTIPIALHLDHLQKNDDLAFYAIDAGFTSVELDFSTQPTSDRAEAVVMNAERCNKIIPHFRKYGVAVEVEEGEIGDAAVREAESLDDIIKQLTTPEDAVSLVERTGGDALAVFVGTAHGFFKKSPFISFKRIRQIAQALEDRGLSAPLVLHGGTGLTYEDFQHAIRNGARKFNYATALADIVLGAVEEEKSGQTLIEEMTLTERQEAGEKGKKSKGPRYVIGRFASQIDKFERALGRAEEAVYEHVSDLITNAFGSVGKASLYGESYSG